MSDNPNSIRPMGPDEDRREPDCSCFEKSFGPLEIGGVHRMCPIHGSGPTEAQMAAMEFKHEWRRAWPDIRRKLLWTYLAMLIGVGLYYLIRWIA